MPECTRPVDGFNGLREPVGPPLVISRKRYIELAALAKETCEFLESKGLKKGEQCLFRQMAEELWWKPSGDEIPF